jgi:hypothetical protein
VYADTSIVNNGRTAMKYAMTRPARKLWILNRLGYIGHDEAEGFIVRAATEGAARRHAAKQAGDEGGWIWEDATESSCKPLPLSGTAGVILRAYVSG